MSWMSTDRMDLWVMFSCSILLKRLFSWILFLGIWLFRRSKMMVGLDNVVLSIFLYVRDSSWISRVPASMASS